MELKIKSIQNLVVSLNTLCNSIHKYLRPLACAFLLMTLVSPQFAKSNEDVNSGNQNEVSCGVALTGATSDASDEKISIVQLAEKLLENTPLVEEPTRKTFKQWVE